MTIATFLSRQRRVLALCAATVLLHYLAIGWAGARIGAAAPRGETPPPPPIVAQLSAPPAPAPIAASAPAPTSQPRPRPKPAPSPARPLGSSAAAPEQFMVAAPDDAPTLPALEAPVPEVVAAAPAEASAPAEAAKPEPAAAPRYKVSLPPSAELTLDVARTDAKGSEWSGKAVLDWRRSGDQYRMTMVASVSLLVTISLAELASEGAVGPDGIAPRSMTEKRRGKAQTATHFNADKGSITFSASEASVPLAPGAQDKTTFMIQLAGIARADPEQLNAPLQLLVGEEKRADVYRFSVVGREDISTPLGTIATVHLTRPPKPGSYNSHLDVWLAPGYDWYPVKIRNTEANGAVTTQTIRKIVALESGK
ncbi:MAG: DUF3108 domain-containing protein [Pseudomonadota bacterium]